MTFPALVIGPDPTDQLKPFAERELRRQNDGTCH